MWIRIIDIFFWLGHLYLLNRLHSFRCAVMVFSEICSAIRLVSVAFNNLREIMEAGLDFRRYFILYISIIYIFIHILIIDF